jgi:hypothetical protein
MGYANMPPAKAFVYSCKGVGLGSFGGETTVDYKIKD